jgi:hypothetical protein
VTHHTHTVATLEVTTAAYEEIGQLLRDAGYGHVFLHDGTIDMTGIGLTTAPASGEDARRARNEDDRRSMG